jgi:hypothetical protein
MYDAVQTTILFEDPFWIALIERNMNGQYSVARVTIGTSEPTGVQLVAFMDQLDIDKLRFTFPKADEHSGKKGIGFKKQLHRNRQIQHNTLSKHTYTKAQAMLKQLQSEVHEERKKSDRILKEEVLKMKFERRQQKRKEKHRGH